MSNVPPVRGSVLVVRGAHTLAARTSDDCTVRTRFQIASVSKQFTAAAVLLLAQRGAVNLDDRIGRRLDGCPPSWQDITLHHLLTHTSGLGHWDEYPMIGLARPVEPAELLTTFHRVPLLFPPGTGWHYSSPAYVLLAHVVQQAAGTPYRDFLATEIFTPLGMADTFAGSAGARPDIATGHDRDGRPVPSWELDVGSVEGHAWFQHSGDNAGFRAFVACLPELDSRFVLLSNSDLTGRDAVTDLLSIALG
jgi:CubicO group peptidase (beta-lactamase class C family)